MFVLPSTQDFNFSEFGLLASGLNKIDSRVVAIYTNGNQSTVFDRVGNVGIGITGIDDATNLSYKLDVQNGDVHLGGSLFLDGSFHT